MISKVLSVQLDVYVYQSNGCAHADRKENTELGAWIQQLLFQHCQFLVDIQYALLQGLNVTTDRFGRVDGGSERQYGQKSKSDEDSDRADHYFSCPLEGGCQRRHIAVMAAARGDVDTTTSPPQCHERLP